MMKRLIVFICVLVMGACNEEGSKKVEEVEEVKIIKIDDEKLWGEFEKIYYDGELFTGKIIGTKNDEMNRQLNVKDGVYDGAVIYKESITKYSEDFKKRESEIVTLKHLIYDEGELVSGKEWYIDGSLRMEIVLGEEKKRQIEYYPSGKIMSEAYLVNGEMEGLKKYYYESGTIKMEENYKNGYLDGDKKSWYEDGRERYIGRFEGGRIVECIGWFGNGQVAIEKKEGKPIYFYDFRGILLASHDLEELIKIKYDRFGREIERRGFAKTGRKRLYEYNEYGQVRNMYDAWTTNQGEIRRYDFWSRDYRGIDELGLVTSVSSPLEPLVPEVEGYLSRHYLVLNENGQVLKAYELPNIGTPRKYVIEDERYMPALDRNQFDERGNHIIQETFFKAENLKFYSEWGYDENNNRITYNKSGFKGELYYDKRGNEIGAISGYRNGTIFKKWEYKYDEMDRMIEEVIYELDKNTGELVESQRETRKYEKTEKEWKDKIWEVDLVEQLIMHKNGKREGEKRFYHLDNKGRIVARRNEIWLDDKGRYGAYSYLVWDNYEELEEGLFTNKQWMITKSYN